MYMGCNPGIADRTIGYWNWVLFPATYFSDEDQFSVCGNDAIQIDSTFHFKDLSMARFVLLIASSCLYFCTSLVTRTYPSSQHRLKSLESDVANSKHAVSQQKHIEDRLSPTIEKTDGLSRHKFNPRLINKVIVETFSKSAHSKSEIDKLRLYLIDNRDGMNQINVITLMHRCAKNKLDLLTFIDIDSILNLLDVKYGGVATAQGIANAVYSLQSMSSSTTGALRLLNVLSEQLLSCREIFDGQAISNTLYGLKGMSVETAEVRGILTAIMKTIQRGLLNHSNGKLDTLDERNYPDREDKENMVFFGGTRLGSKHPSTSSVSIRMTPQGIGSAFIGLQGMSSSNSDVRIILSILANSICQLTKCGVSLDSQAVANILVGLKSSSSEHAEVREVLIALCKNLKKNISIFKDIQPRELSMSLQGLQGMSSEHPQVDQLLEVICDGLDYRIFDCKSPEQSFHNNFINSNGHSNNRNNGFEFKSGDEVGPALGGLKQMSAENLHVRRLLKHIGRAIKPGGTWTKPPSNSVQALNSGTERKVAKTSPGFYMNEQNIANSLYGLQSMDCRTEEVRTILSAIAKEIMAFDGTLSGRTVANSLYGLQCMTANTCEVKAVLKAITKKMDREAMDYTGQHIAMSLYGLQWMTASSKEMEYLIIALAERIEASSIYLSGTHLASSVYGMQSMTSNYPYVRRLLKALADKMPALSVISRTEDDISNSPGSTTISSSTSSLSSSKSKLRVAASMTAVDKNIYQINSQLDLSLSGQETAMVMHGLRCMGSEWAQVQDMLSAITYRMRTPPITTIPTTPENSTSVPLSSPSLWARSDGGSSRTTEPGPELGGTVIIRNEVSSGISRSSLMTAKELSRALNGLQNMGGGRIATPSPLQQQSISLTSGISYNVLPWVDDDGDSIVPGSKNRQRVPIPLLQVLTALADRLETRAERLSGPMVATAVYGLQGLSADIPPVRRIVRILAADLMESSIALDSRNMGNIMYGMQKMTMTSRNRQVRELLSSISKAFKMSPFPLSAQAVGNCFYGLQGMSSEIPEVRGVLRALASKVNEMPLAPSIDIRTDNVDKEKVKEERIGENDNLNDRTKDRNNKSLKQKDPNYNEPRISKNGHDNEDSRFRSSKVEYMMSGQNIGNALWGLRNTTSEYEEVREALAALAVKISQSNAELNGQNIGNALYSLHSMDGEALEVRAVLNALAHKIVLSKQPLSGLDIGMSLFGLRSMDAEIPEVRVILAALIVKIKESNCQLKLRDLSMAIIGVLNATPWIRDDFLKLLASKTPGMSPYIESDRQTETEVV